MDEAPATGLCDLANTAPATADEVEALLAAHDPAMAARYRVRVGHAAAAERGAALPDRP